MINYKTILDAIQTLFEDNLTGYTIVRNERRNDDPLIAAKGKGWIGIYRGSMVYESARIGAQSWHSEIEPRVEIQVASMKSGEDAENRLQDAEYEIMGLLTDNIKLSNSVGTTTGYEIEYQYNEGAEEMYHLSAIITIKTRAET